MYRDERDALYLRERALREALELTEEEAVSEEDESALLRRIEALEAELGAYERAALTLEARTSRLVEILAVAPPEPSRKESTAPPPKPKAELSIQIQSTSASLVVLVAVPLIAVFVGAAVIHVRLLFLSLPAVLGGLATYALTATARRIELRSSAAGDSNAAQLRSSAEGDSNGAQLHGEFLRIVTQDTAGETRVRVLALEDLLEISVTKSLLRAGIKMRTRRGETIKLSGWNLEWATPLQVLELEAFVREVVRRRDRHAKEPTSTLVL